jgi:hypothetical protein
MLNLKFLISSTLVETKYLGKRSKKNILNFDQVPRYFEHTSKRTLAKKRSRDVKLRKASTSHKRFTFTPLINADGDIEAIYCLFSNLKNVPQNCNSNVMVRVNKTGMWGEEHVKDFIKTKILARPATSFHREPVLVIIDSDGPHLKVDKTYERYNVHIVFVPELMTGLLQMLDVSFNRPFQVLYGGKVDEYLQRAIDDPHYRTAQGNIQLPTYKVITDWCHEFSENISRELFKKSFQICGLDTDLPFQPDQCHFALSELLSGSSLETIENMLPHREDIELLYNSSANVF